MAKPANKFPALRRRVVELDRLAVRLSTSPAPPPDEVLASIDEFIEALVSYLEVAERDREVT